MKIRYIILIIVALILGVITIWLPENNNSMKEVSPDELHQALLSKTRFVTTTEIAHMIISSDPSYYLIDIRSEENYKKFHLTDAIHIPVTEIISEKMKKYLSKDYQKIILYGNGTVKADQCWMLLKRMGYNNVYVLDGGLNKWMDEIVEAKAELKQQASNTDLDNYRYRLAANQYFTGNDSLADIDIQKIKSVFISESDLESDLMETVEEH